MITGGGNANGSQLLTDGLYRFAGSALDNAAAVPVVEDIFFNITFFIPRAGHTKIEVGAIKAGGQRKRLVELQQGNDILLYLFRWLMHRGLLWISVFILLGCRKL